MYTPGMMHHHQQHGEDFENVNVQVSCFIIFMDSLRKQEVRNAGQ